MDQQFAIITFRNSGPIKTWSDMRGANVHNARTKPIEHAMPGAPAPEHLIGSPDLVADVRHRLRRVGIDPSRMRKNGVIAYEAIMTASPAFFEEGDAQARAARLRDWTSAQVEFAKKRWGVHRVVSMVLHQDEKTPHIHLVILPLEVRNDLRQRDKTAVRWSLVGRTISGPGQFDQLQDDYAAAMASFGLSRGVRGSGRKHEPVPVYLTRLAAKEQSVDVAREDIARDRAATVADRSRIEAERQAIEHQGRIVAERAAQLDREDVNRRLQVRREREAMMAELDQDRQRLRRWDLELVEAEKAVRADQAELAARQATFDRFRDELTATREKLVPIVGAAKEFVAAAAGITVADVAPKARQAVAAGRQVMDACRLSYAAKVVDPQFAASELAANGFGGGVPPVAAFGRG